MTPRELHIFKKLGIDPDRPREEVLQDLLNLADYLYNCLEEDEKTRFMKELRRLILKPTN